MKKFLRQLILFPSILVIILIVSIYLTTYIVKNRDFKVDQTDSNTLVMKKNQHYDVIFSGASHSRNLSRYGNHYRMEKILDKSLTNIAQGAATCGVQEQFFYLKYFYEEGNTVDQIVYLMSPGLIYSKSLPYASNTFNKECFNHKLISRYYNFPAENKRQRVFEYIRSKLSWDWITLMPLKDTIMPDVLAKVDPIIVKQGIEMYYVLEESMDQFKISCNVLEEEIKYALDHNTKTVLIIPPAVFGKWPGHDNLVEFAERMQVKYGTNFYDYSESIMQPQYYYDHHHLNTKGVVYFTEKYLKPIL